ncbi:MAG: manganese efflux pump MntP family protein [Oscillospiraceae bacterium]|nr:manganese efflux pump MntP family protein [Oscillospiraceae bacterium]
MRIWEIVLLGLGLSMDAAAVSAVNGLAMKKRRRAGMILLMAVVFGGFQGIMPIIGYYAGSVFTDIISQYAHMIALFLLTIIGGKMILDGIKEEKKDDIKSITVGLILVQGVATSIDALSIGVGFAALSVNIWIAAAIISLTTFAVCILTVPLGIRFSNTLKSKAGIIGGLILIGIGIKIFIDHVFM